MTIINQVTSFKISGFSYTGTDSQLNYTSGVTPGVAEPSKALVLNTAGNITSGINNLTINTLYTTNLSVGGYLFNNTSLAVLTALDGAIPGVAVESKVLIVDGSRNITNLNNLSALSLTGTITTVSQPNITSLGTLTGLLTNGNLNIIQHNGTSGLQLAGILITSSALEINKLTGLTASTSELNKLTGLTASTSELNKLTGLTASTIKLNYVDITTTGIAQANKALITDSSNNISGINQLSSNTILATGALTTNLNILQLLDSNLPTNGERYISLGITWSAYNAGYISFYNVSSGNTSNRLRFGLHTTGNVLNIVGTGNVGISTETPGYKLDVNGSINCTSLYLNGNLITTTPAQLNYLDISSIGTAQSSKALVLDASSNISGINIISANVFTGVSNTVSDFIILQNTNSSARTSMVLKTNNGFWEIGTRGTTETDPLYRNGYYFYYNTQTSGLGTTGFKGSINYNGYMWMNRFGTASNYVRYSLDLGATVDNRKICLFNTGSNTDYYGFGANSSSLIYLTKISHKFYYNSTDVNLGTLGIEMNSGNMTLFNTTASTSSSTGALIVNGGVGIGGNLYLSGSLNVSSNINGIINTNNQPNITSTGNLTIPNSITITNGNTPLNITNSTSLSSLNCTIQNSGGDIDFGSTTNHNLYLKTNNIRQLHIDTNGNINIINHNLLSTGLHLAGVLVTSSAPELNILDGVTATTTELNYLDITVVGSGEANKAVILDTNRDISNINHIQNAKMTITNNTNNTLTIKNTITSGLQNIYFDGYLTTNKWEVGTRNQDATEPKNGFYIYNNTYRFVISSTGNVGIGTTTPSYKLDLIGDLNISNGNVLRINGNDISTILTGITLGTTTASKVLTVDSSLNVSGINNISATTFSGTISTASQPNITSIGTLNGLTCSGLLYASNSTASTTPTTGALIVTGGLGVSGAINTASTIKTTSAGQGFIHTQTSTNTITLVSYINDALISNTAYFGTTTNSHLSLQTNNADRMRITSTGDIGIGISPAYKLDVSGTFRASGNTILSSSTSSTSTTSGALTVTGGVGIGGNLYIGGNSVISGTLTTTGSIYGTLATNAQPNITSTGILQGIGIVATDATIGGYGIGGALWYSTTGRLFNCRQINDNYLSLMTYQYGGILHDMITYDHNNGSPLYVIGDGSTNINMTVSGNLSVSQRINVGGSTDTSRLISALTGSSTTAYFTLGSYNSVGNQSEIYFTYIGSNSSSNRLSLGFHTNNTILNILNSSRVGINTTSPTEALHVSGNIKSSGNYSGTNVQLSQYVYSSDATGTARYIGNWGLSNYWGLGIDSSNIVTLGVCSSTGVWTGYTNLKINSLYCNGTQTITVGSYAYHTSSNNTGTSSGMTNNYSVYAAGRMACNGEFNIISDYRTKNTIQPLESEYCKNFIKKTLPVKYYLNDEEKNINKQKHFGYIAQDVLKAGFPDLVTCYPKPGLEEIIEKDGFKNPKDVAFSMSTNEIIPILSKNIQLIYEEKELLEKKIINLENENNLLKEQINKIISRISILESYVE